MAVIKKKICLVFCAILLIGHVYVANGACSDTFSFCSSLSNSCYQYLNGILVRDICANTCGVCSSVIPACVDTNNSTCRSLYTLCGNSAFTIQGKSIRDYCPLTCGNCSASNACSPNPCLNSGTCFLISTNSYGCICPSGISGKLKMFRICFLMIHFWDKQIASL